MKSGGSDGLDGDVVIGSRGFRKELKLVSEVLMIDLQAQMLRC